MALSVRSARMIDQGNARGVELIQRESSKGGWRAAIFIIFVEVAERFAFFGLSSNLIIYLTDELQEPTSTAVKMVNTWVGVSHLSPIVGALVADSFLGRFNIILVAFTIYSTGIVLLNLSVSVLPSHNRKATFFTALYAVAVGEGGHKPCMQTFAADQLDEESPEDKKAKSSFFNWWYCGIGVGATSSTLAVVYIQDNVSWAVGFGVLGTAFALSLVIFLVGIKWYRKQGTLGSPFTTVAQVLVAAARKWRVKETSRILILCSSEPKGRALVHTNQLRFLDKATVIDNVDESSERRNPWRLCFVNQVEEVKLVLRLIPIWLCSLIFAIVESNVQTYFTKQASTMKRSVGTHFEIPSASLQALVGITAMTTIPLYDRVFVPTTRRFTGHLSGVTLLQRIGIGLFLSSLTMVVSALVEAKRVSVAVEYDLLDDPKATVPMTVWWLLPQFTICGLSNVFVLVGLQELFYDQMPESMRSLGGAAYVAVAGAGSFVSSAIISIVQAISARCGYQWLGNNLNRAHLNGFYWVLAGLSALNLCVYMGIALRFMYKKVDEDDALP